MENEKVVIELTKGEGLDLFQLLMELDNSGLFHISETGDCAILFKIKTQLEEEFFGESGCESMEMIEELRLILEDE